MRRPWKSAFAAATLRLWLTVLGAMMALSSPFFVKASAGHPAFPKDMAVVTRLLTNVDSHHSKVGDRVEAEVIGDVKQDGQTLLKKGSHIIGQITEVGPGTAVRIVFQTVALKGGEQTTADLEIYALRAQTDAQLAIQDGRGMGATNINAGVAGGLEAEHAPITPETVGIQGFPGLKMFPMDDGKPGTVLKSAGKEVHIPKGTLMVLHVEG